METDKCIKSKVLTPEEYSIKAHEFYVAGDVEGFIEFQRTHSILYVNLVPESDEEILKNIDISDIPDFLEPM